MNLAEKVRLAGVVGAGGGGFPAHIKLSAKADTVIANGAECEPLLHKDAAVMENYAEEIVDGMLLAMSAVGAVAGVIGVKGKKHHAVEAMQRACHGKPVRVQLLGDYYPAGDEYDLVHEVTGRLIPPAGIPIQVGVVVSNVETLMNIAAAQMNLPVTDKTITVAGAVVRPLSLTVPIGTPFSECIRAAGGSSVPDPVLCLGGLMMGETTGDLETPVTKTTTGAVVLPRDHHVIERKLKPSRAKARIGKSACDQCRYCTEFCPRFLLGYAVEPHQVMRSLAFTGTGQEYLDQWAALCCACGLCTLFACPEELFPKEACDDSKGAMRRANIKWSGPAVVKPHPMREGRRVPIQSLMRKLHIKAYDVPAPFERISIEPGEVVLPLKQSAGAPCVPLVKQGDRVEKGQPLGDVPAGALGAMLHAPFAGRIAQASPDRLILQRTR
jgi:Na+-translocating ferredoxin:NAD+ oxidoreductase RnfC subunit